MIFERDVNSDFSQTFWDGRSNKYIVLLGNVVLLIASLVVQCEIDQQNSTRGIVKHEFYNKETLLSPCIRSLWIDEGTRIKQIISQFQ